MYVYTVCKRNLKKINHNLNFVKLVEQLNNLFLYPLASVEDDSQPEITALGTLHNT